MRIWVAALAALLLLPSCGSGTQLAAPTGNAPSAEHDLAVADLDKLVAPQGDIGGLPLGLRVTSDSGWQDNRAEAESSIDPGDSEASLQREGRITGYELIYDDPTKAALRSGAGVLTVMTWVELFQSRDAAAAYLKKQTGYARALAGKSPQDGVTFGAVTAFNARVAEESYGLREEATFGRDHVNRTLISFRRGRVLAGSMYIRADERDASTDALRVAGILDARIQEALRGGLSEQPVPIPKDGLPQDSQEPVATRPAGAPDLAALALKPADLPSETTYDAGQYTRTASPRITFRRNFVLAGAPVGRSRVVQLVSEVSVFDSEEAAKASLSLTATSLAEPGATKRFATNLAATGGLQATHIRTRAVRLGAGATGCITTFKTNLGPLVDFYALVQRGRGLTTLEVLGIAQGFRYQDLVPLLDKTAQRVNRKLG